MPRTRRLKVVGDVAYYHIISKIVGGEFLLKDTEKEKLLSIIKHFSSLFFVKVIGFCIMDNHFHLLIRTFADYEVDNDELLRRLKDHKKLPDRELTESEILAYRKKYIDISEYVKAIKVTFSRWYNRHNDRSGYLWGDRFKSVLVEDGRSLLNMLAYIELNPVRAKICDRPEDYRWNSISYRLGVGDGFLSFEGTEIRDLREYLEFLYQVGKSDRVDEMGNLQGKIEDGARPRLNIFKHRVRYFTDTLVIGSKGFVEDAYRKFSDLIKKKDRNAHRVPIDSEVMLYSLRRLNRT